MQRFALLLVVTIATTASCKGKPARREAPANAQGTASIATTAKGSAGSASDVLHLPNSGGLAPKKTSSALTTSSLDRMLAMRFEGFGLQNDVNTGVFVAVLRTVDRPKLKVTVQVRPCNGTCMSIDLAKWKGRTDLKNDVMGPEMRSSDQIKFEVGETDLNGTPMIYTYQYGILKTPQGTRYTDTYVLWYNDGQNEIRSIATYADNGPDSVEAMLALAPKDDLEKLAKAFTDVYTQAWVD